MKQSLAEYWESFRTEALADGMPEHSLELLRHTFYSGAKAASMMMRGRTVAEARNRAQRLHAELEAHQQELFADLPIVTDLLI